jgi:predicted transcriptional regulator
MMTTTTIELPDELRAKAETLAHRTGRSLAEVLTGAVAQGLDYDLWVHDEVNKGLRATENGDLATSAEVDALWGRVTTPEALAEAEAELGPQ